ncbi:MAG: hypothetical protein JWM78_1827 [Verrucomicrobiaceae bacterium]|nr:hypothetical protein [Verrucomicrobiaceae bacterium]
MPTTINNLRKDYSEGAWQLMVAAEKLFGQRGIESVSLREIAAAANHANTSAVAYHFGSKENLVQAVFEMRLPALDAARARRLAEARAAGPLSMRTLVTVMLLPILEEFNAQDLENFALFMTRLAQRHSAEQAFFQATDIVPASVEIIGELAKQLKHLPQEALGIRLRLGTDLFLDSVAEHKYVEDSSTNPYLDEAGFWDDILNLVVAVMEAPLTARLKPCT